MPPICLNYTNVKLVNVLNNPGVGHTIMNTAQTPTSKSINWQLAPSSNSLALNMWNELATTITQQKHIFLLIHVHKQLFQDLIIAWGRWTRAISHKIKTMTWRWGHDLQIKIPFTIEMKRSRMWEVLPVI